MHQRINFRYCHGIKLDVTETAQKFDNPIKIFKWNNDRFHISSINLNIVEQVKCTDIKPAFTKDSRNDKSDYKPIEIFSNILHTGANNKRIILNT